MYLRLLLIQFPQNKVGLTTQSKVNSNINNLIMKVNVKRKSLISAVLLLTSLGVTTSCIDNSYDLDKDIDMTINVGGQYLAFPIGSTEKITLDKIIEVKKGDDLQVINGAYHLIREDDIAQSTTKVGLANVDDSNISIPSINVVNEYTFPNKVNYTTENIESTGKTKIEIKDIDQTVKEIGSLTAKENVNLTINFQLAGELKYNKITIKTLTIVFPEFLQFKGEIAGLKGNEYTKNDIVIDKASGFNIELPVTGFLFGTKYGEGKKIVDGSFSLNEQVKVETIVEVEGIDLNTKASLSITPSIVLGAMDINSITGTIKPEINVESIDVELSNLPDFLQDDDVKLNITNPIISFKANNPLKTNIELDGVMTGYKDGKMTKTVMIGSANGGEAIILKPSGMEQQTISLSRTDTEGSVFVPNLNDIIEIIPDYITVELTPSIKTYDYHTVDLGKDYALKSSYKIDIPLSFGDGMQIVYKDSVDGFRSDLEDIEFKKVAIAMTADNAIPLKLEIKDSNVTPKDVNGKQIDGVKVTVTGVIAESKDGVAASTSQLAIAIEETTEGAMNKVDGIEFKVTAVPGQATNVQLRSDQWVQLKEIKLRVPNGIKVDLN